MLESGTYYSFCVDDLEQECFNPNDPNVFVSFLRAVDSILVYH